MTTANEQQQRSVPSEVMFLCEPERFLMLDSARYLDFLDRKVDPWWELKVTPQGALAKRPVKVVGRGWNTVTVATADRAIKINLATRQITSVLPDGTNVEFIPSHSGSHLGKWQPIVPGERRITMPQLSLKSFKRGGGKKPSPPTRKTP